MNHLIDISVVKNDVWAIQNRIDRPHSIRRSDFNILRRLKPFLLKMSRKKFIFQKIDQIFHDHAR